MYAARAEPLKVVNFHRPIGSALQSMPSTRAEPLKVVKFHRSMQSDVQTSSLNAVKLSLPSTAKTEETRKAVKVCDKPKGKFYLHFVFSFKTNFFFLL